MSDAPPVPAVPRLSATVLLLRDDPFRVLMVRRGERREDQFSSALVFPGGVVDPDDHGTAWRDHVDGAADLAGDERALRIAAARETLEEVGISLARDAAGRPVSGEGRDLQALLRATGARLPLRPLVHFGHWITPETVPRRYDTHFYLCRAPEGAEAICDGLETLAPEWVAPREALARGEDGRQRILFPTRCNLMRLAESGDIAGALAAARARARFTVLPHAIGRDGRVAMSIPAEAGYRLTEDTRDAD